MKINGFLYVMEVFLSVFWLQKRVLKQRKEAALQAPLEEEEVVIRARREEVRGQ